MPSVPLFNSNGETTGALELQPAVFGLKARREHLHTAVKAYLAAQRLGTVATKTKGLVSGGGKKPYPQKGTGNARQGSIRAPQWKGGGTVFGPQPRDFSFDLPKKFRRLALHEALSDRAQDEALKVIENFTWTEPKTKNARTFLKQMGLIAKTVLVVVADSKPEVQKSFRNLWGVSVRTVGQLNVYDVLRHEVLVMEKKAVDALVAFTGKGTA